MLKWNAAWQVPAKWGRNRKIKPENFATKERKRTQLVCFAVMIPRLFFEFFGWPCLCVPCVAVKSFSPLRRLRLLLLKIPRLSLGFPRGLERAAGELGSVKK
jgi:hypothetical protein